MNTTTTNNQTHHPVDYQQPLAAPLSREDAEALTAAVLNSPYSNRVLGTAEGTCAPAIASNPASTPASATAAAMGAPQRCTYRDCLMGRANIPVHGPGKAAFTLLMVGGMVTFMATFNGALSSGLGFFAHAHWMYPLVFCIAFLMRLYVGDRVVGFAAPRYVIPRFHGLARNIAMTLLNVVVMGAIMGSIITLLLKGSAGFWSELASTLPLTMTVAALVNYFVVGPAVKMIYNNVLEPTNGLGLFNWAQRYAMPWTAIFGN